MLISTPQNKTVQVRCLGLVGYQTAWDEQERLFADTLARKLDNRSRPPHAQEPTPNYLLFCEHPHVYTLGKSGHQSHLLANPDVLSQLGATYHRKIGRAHV